jgi:phosphoribosylglycinamide formyltransferase-1
MKKMKMSKVKRVLKIGVLASGSGSNLQAIINSIESGSLDAQILVVIVNNTRAFAMERACQHNIPALVIDHKGFASRAEFDAALVGALKERGVELVVMAGFMRILTPAFFAAFPQRVLNIHPALLPAFPGVDAQRQAFDYGVKFAGCTVHFADAGVDTGPIVMQAVVDVHDNDTRDTLAERILAQEHRLYPQVIQLYAEGRLEIRGRKVFIKDAPSESAPTSPYR